LQKRDGYFTVFALSGPEGRVGLIVEVPVSVLEVEGKLGNCACWPRCAAPPGNGIGKRTVRGGPGRRNGTAVPRPALVGIFTDVISSSGTSMNEMGMMRPGKPPDTKVERRE